MLPICVFIMLYTFYHYFKMYPSTTYFKKFTIKQCAVLYQHSIMQFVFNNGKWLTYTTSSSVCKHALWYSHNDKTISQHISQNTSLLLSDIKAMSLTLHSSPVNLTLSSSLVWSRSRILPCVSHLQFPHPTTTKSLAMCITKLSQDTMSNKCHGHIQYLVSLLL
jgi:hypothetical protein